MTFFWICFGLFLAALGLAVISLATTFREHVTGRLALDTAYMDIERASLRQIVQLECPLCTNQYVATLVVGETRSECPNCNQVHAI